MEVHQRVHKNQRSRSKFKEKRRTRAPDFVHHRYSLGVQMSALQVHRETKQASLEQIEVHDGVLRHHQQKQLEVYQRPLSCDIMVHVVQKDLLVEHVHLMEHRADQERGAYAVFGDEKQSWDHVKCDLGCYLRSPHFRALNC